MIAALIAVGVFFYLTGPTVATISKAARRHRPLRPRPADLRVDGVVFRIPANYTKFRRSRYDGDQDDVPMHALSAELLPWSPGDAAAFAQQRAERTRRSTSRWRSTARR